MKGHWTNAKVEFFIEHYFLLREYEVQYGDDMQIPTKLRTHRAYFENAAINMAEFETAMKRLGRTYFHTFYCIYIAEMPVEGYAWFTNQDTEFVREVAVKAKGKMINLLCGGK